MAKNRTVIPNNVRDRVLDEYNHRCAVCGADRPQLHHIDEDPSNHDPLNLIPLCPNCHLSDKHNPTVTPNPNLLALFRKYKDPCILKPQFIPVFQRMVFLDMVDSDQFTTDAMRSSAEELQDFVGEMEMGKFYAKKIGELSHPKYTRLAVAVDMRAEERSQERKIEYQAQLRQNRETISALVVELLRFQKWE
jgi:hypothetical protein